jgi:sugar (pentulose or hexulose) kinase
MEALRFDSSRLPEVVRPGTLIGETCNRAQEDAGIPSGVPIYAGMTDGCAAQIASGTISIGSWNSVIGTTLVMKGVTHHLMHDPFGVIYSHRSPDGMWLPGGASSTGAGIIAKEFDRRKLAQLNEAALLSEPTGLAVYPLAGKGERFPFSAPDAEGFSIGHANSQEVRYRSSLEGIAYIERLSFDVLRSLGASVEGNLTISGGATNSEAFNQIRADILERPLTIPSIPESAFGMAVLAAASTSSFQKAVQKMVHISRVIEPSRPFTAYAEQYSTLIVALERRGWLPRTLTAAALEGVHS